MREVWSQFNDEITVPVRPCDLLPRYELEHAIAGTTGHDERVGLFEDDKLHS